MGIAPDTRGYSKAGAAEMMRRYKENPTPFVVAYLIRCAIFIGSLGCLIWLFIHNARLKG